MQLHKCTFVLFYRYSNLHVILLLKRHKTEMETFHGYNNFILYPS